MHHNQRRTELGIAMSTATSVVDGIFRRELDNLLRPRALTACKNPPPQQHTSDNRSCTGVTSGEQAGQSTGQAISATSAVAAPGESQRVAVATAAAAAISAAQDSMAKTELSTSFVVHVDELAQLTRQGVMQIVKI